KINVDGAVAAICRDQTGLYLGSSSVFFQGTNDPHILETYACREALALAEDLVVIAIYVASDCQGVVDDINRGTGGPNAATIHEITNHCNSFISCSFIHEHRNFNFEAHNLAKFACNL
uniref:RNase H type-1 domain-containing protein n=1 Tax=Aegilops tauschii subsp. strangulata TaxID=200361 RepID=A0A453RUI6_AEGTS